jgi:hypothetical protein
VRGGVGGYRGTQGLPLAVLSRVSIKLFTSYQHPVDKVLPRVYSYQQVKSYIRVEIVDNYDL